MRSFTCMCKLMLQHLTCSEVFSCNTSHFSCPVHMFTFIVHHLAVIFNGCRYVILFCEGSVTGSVLCAWMRAHWCVRV